MDMAEKIVRRIGGRLMGAALFVSLVLGHGTASAADDGGGGGSRIFMTTATGGGGALIAVERVEPWKHVHIADLDSADAAVQSAFGRVFVVEPESDLVRVFDGEGKELNSFSVGVGTQPRDIYVVAPNLAYVSRFGASHLYRVNPMTGEGSDAIDLSVLADEDGNPDMVRMASDGERLFVQIRRVDAEKPWLAGPAALAVIDLATETLLDADPKTLKIDGIELDGPSARLRMHVASDASFLLVSATAENHLDLSGGIEYINLNTLTSEGFIAAESELAAIGGFVMVDDERGYFLFHTDIVASNHLKPFTITHGPDTGLEIVFDWGNYLDALLIDPLTGLLYMPASAGGMYVVDTANDEQLTKTPIALGGMPMDMVIGPVGLTPDLNGDGSVGVPDLIILLSSWGACSDCSPGTGTGTGTCPADLDGNCAVGVADVLIVLSSWG